MISLDIAAALYLVAGVLFILALRGLSHPETSRQGNMFGMVGMGIAILATLFSKGMGFGGIALVIAGLAIGGGIAAPVAAYTCKRIPLRPFMFLVGLLVIGLSLRTLIRALA